MDLYEYAFCGSDKSPGKGFWPKLAHLAELAAPELWSFQVDTDPVILYRYIKHTFARLTERPSPLALSSSVPVSADRMWSCFNTGLYTPQYEAIYGLFQVNRVPGMQPWHLRGFYRESERILHAFDVLPSRAEYFDDPSELVFDHRCEIRVDKEHILTDEENVARLPLELTNPIVFDGAVSTAKKKVAANYKLAVPQYFQGKVQLLIPLGFEPDRTDAALVLSRHQAFYAGHTCLTLDMAYNNARLIAKPEAEWLRIER